MGDNPRAVRERQRWDTEAAGYDSWQEQCGSIYNQVIARVVDDLTADSRTVEIGCGTGLVTLGVAHMLRSIGAYDISEEMLTIAREKASQQNVGNVEFLVGDAYGLPDADASFDAALVCYVLDIVESPEKVLAEAHRLLDKTGTLISVTDCYQDTWSPSGPRRILREIMRALRRILRKTGAKKHRQSIPRDTELMRLTNDCGFRIVESAILETGERNHFALYIMATKF